MRSSSYGLWLVSPFFLAACHDSSGSSAFLAPGVNDLGRTEGLLAFEDGIVAAAVLERADDLNGDGDRVDLLLEVLDVRSGKRTYLSNVATGNGVTTGAGFVTFEVNEASAGSDLNGDGDELDAVVHVHDARRGSTRNLGLAPFDAPVQEGSLIAVGVHEEPGLDLNGDGDFQDSVTHVFQAERGLLTVLPSDSFPSTVRIEGRRVFFETEHPESVQIYDADTGQLRTIDLVIDGMWVQGSLLALLVPEWENGDVDRNGNGSTDDDFVELHDLDTGHVQATDKNDCWILALGEDLAVVALEQYPDPVEVRVYDRLGATLSAPIGRWSSVAEQSGLTSDRRHAYLVDEVDVGLDLDGDGQQADKVLHVFDARTGTTKSIGKAAYSDPQIDARRVAFLGLATAGYLTVHALDLHTGVVSDLGLAASEFRLVDGRILALTPEEWQGEDLDGDLALTHTVLQVHDLGSGRTLNTGLVTGNLVDEFDPIVVDGEVLALAVDGRLKLVRLR